MKHIIRPLCLWENVAEASTQASVVYRVDLGPVSSVVWVMKVVIAEWGQHEVNYCKHSKTRIHELNNNKKKNWEYLNEMARRHRKGSLRAAERLVLISQLVNNVTSKKRKHRPSGNLCSMSHNPFLFTLARWDDAMPLRHDEISTRVMSTVEAGGCF